MSDQNPHSGMFVNPGPAANATAHIPVNVQTGNTATLHAPAVMAGAPPAPNPHANLAPGFSFAGLLEAETAKAECDLGLDGGAVVLDFYPRKLTPELLDRINAQDTAKKNLMAEKGASAVLDGTGVTRYGVIDGLLEVVFDWNIPDMPWGEPALRRLGFPVLLKLWQAVNESMMGNDDGDETETSF